MKKVSLLTLAAALFIIAITACQKSGSSSNNAITVENLSGTYSLKALLWNYGGISINVLDSLDACEKDNLVKLNTDKTVNFIDAGIVCDPPSDDNGMWDLKGDSIKFSDNLTSAKIESYDGKTLVLSGTPDGVPGVIATTTLVKQ
jgi:hypothetical protein